MCQARGNKLAEIPLRNTRVAQHHSGTHVLTQGRIRQGKDHSLGNGRMLQQNFFHFTGRNLFAAAVNDLLDATLDEEITVGINPAEVSRAKPSLGECSLRGLIRIATHNVRAAHYNFAELAWR